MLSDCEDVYMLTLCRWNHHNSAHASTKESLLDWQGNMVEKNRRQKILLEDVEENVNIASVSYIDLVESKVIKNLL